MGMSEPTWDSEFEVQAWLWNELRAIGMNVRGEVKYRLRSRAYCRFDLAEFDADGRLIGVIEVKARPVAHKTSGGWKATRQGQRYTSLDVPVVLVCGMEQARSLVERARAAGSLFVALEAA